MTTPSDRIRTLVQKGILPPDEAEALLAALHVPARPRWTRLLIDPFERLGGAHLTLVGVAVAVAGIALERVGLRFDGFMDMHLTQRPWRLEASAADAFAAWPLAAIVLWIVSLVAGRQGRFIDFLGLVGVARVPSVLFALPVAAIATGRPILDATSGHTPALTPSLLAAAAFGLVGVAWLLTLLYRGFGTASGLHGTKRVVAFVVGAVLAEVASKIVLMFLV